MLIDAGLFQGLKNLRRLNWKRPAFDPAALDALLLTHTHIDHVGYLPRLVKDGFDKPVYSTRATCDLAAILLLDAAEIQEEDAAYANRKGFSKHRPALPLYTKKDARNALKLFRSIPYGEWLSPAPGLRARYWNAGHILGSAMIEVEVDRPSKEPYRIVFSGGVGRYDMPLHPDPAPRPICDTLVVESTYGDRDHDNAPFEDQIEKPFRQTLERGGVVLVPSFAVGRAQQVTLIFRGLMREGRIPEVPIHIDSPMAVDATEIYDRYCDEHNLDACVTENGESVLFPRMVRYHRSVAESKSLNKLEGPRIIVSASGMMTNGRILHHLSQKLTHPENLLCMVGFQMAGTRGRRLLEGAKTIRIHGRDIRVRSRIMAVHGLSGHAGRSELLRWIDSGHEMPKRAFVVHGEPDSATALAKTLQDDYGIEATVPALGEGFELT